MNPGVGDARGVALPGVKTMPSDAGPPTPTWGGLNISLLWYRYVSLPAKRAIFPGNMLILPCPNHMKRLIFAHRSADLLCLFSSA